MRSLLGQYSFAAQVPESFYHLDQSWVMVQEIEILKIEVMPGWRKGTKIKFEGKGDEKPGYLPVEISLVDALTGCSLPIPILGGEKLTLSFENTVVYPGYVKVIEGQGMPTLKNDGKRGNLHVKFLVDFPKELSDEQRQEAFRILENCC
ncbi:protein psi1-like isoform X2 [Arachis ipaensis]|uniref:protein psi1-like isoform X2 n=1 Tax=Arachis ipaensis TaxID=130454 RepID=UPI000A2B7842|nr:protein psi1-like isoform X2 [Arachis ipaensis]